MPDVSKLTREVLTIKRGDIFSRLKNLDEYEYNFMRFVESINRLRSNTIPSNQNYTSYHLKNYKYYFLFNNYIILMYQIDKKIFILS